MRNNHKKAKRLQQVRGKTLRTNPNLQNVKPAFKTKSALSILLLPLLGVQVLLQFNKVPLLLLPVILKTWVT